MTLSSKVSLVVAPALEYTSFSNLPDGADLDYTDISLTISAIRRLNADTSLSLTGQIGRRNSNDESRDSNFAELPISLRLRRSF